jgi:hypothetical protein
MTGAVRASRPRRVFCGAFFWNAGRGGIAVPVAGFGGGGRFVGNGAGGGGRVLARWARPASIVTTLRAFAVDASSSNNPAVGGIVIFSVESGFFSERRASSKRWSTRLARRNRRRNVARRRRSFRRSSTFGRATSIRSLHISAIDA